MLNQLQFLYPKKLISFLAKNIANCKIKWLKNSLIKLFISHYKVDLTKAKIKNYKDFKTFNDFFTRELARSIQPHAGAIISPADGFLQNCGPLQDNITAKNYHFILKNLLANNQFLSHFINGSFFTVYLSPKDYHRVHMPYDGVLLHMDYIPGRLFSVNQSSTASIANIFSRNERVICYFKGDFGIFAVRLVGAIIVGSISTVWHGTVNAVHNSQPASFSYLDQNIVLKQGAELGRFALGSTAIVLLPNDLGVNFAIKPGQNIKTGDIISKL